MPLKGEDGLWRTMVEVDGQPCVQIVPEPVGSSARWVVSETERAVLADLLRLRGDAE